MASIPHLQIPLNLTPEHSFACNEQETLEDLAQCITVLMYTELGDRIEVPAYGVKPMVFAQVDSVSVLESIHRWEPRAAVNVSAVVGENWDDLVTNVVETVRNRR